MIRAIFGTTRGIITITALSTLLTGGMVGWLTGFFGHTKAQVVAEYHDVSETITSIDLTQVVMGLAGIGVLLLVLMIILDT